MSEEIFEVVDDNNNVVGLEKRSIVHKTGLPHRGVYVLLFNSRKELLLQKRASSKKIAPSTWDVSSAEHLKPGESFEEAAKRGLEEEVKIFNSAPNHVLDFRYTHEYNVGLKDDEFNSVFELVYDGAFAPDKEEVSEAKFFSLEQVKKMLEENPGQFAPWVEKVLRLYFEKKKLV